MTSERDDGAADHRDEVELRAPGSNTFTAPPAHRRGEVDHRVGEERAEQQRCRRGRRWRAGGRRTRSAARAASGAAAVRRRWPRMFAAANRMNDTVIAYGAAAMAAGTGANRRSRASGVARSRRRSAPARPPTPARTRPCSGWRPAGRRGAPAPPARSGSRWMPRNRTRPAISIDIGDSVGRGAAPGAGGATSGRDGRRHRIALEMAGRPNNNGFRSSSGFAGGSGGTRYDDGSIGQGGGRRRGRRARCRGRRRGRARTRRRWASRPRCGSCCT